MDERLERLFELAVNLDDAERGEFLQRECGGQDTLRAAVEQLVQDSRRADELLGATIARATESVEPSPGSVVGPWRLIRQIGHGGMGVVFLAERADDQFEQQVAIKFVQAGGNITSRFLQERRILARLAHPNIARLLNAGVSPSGTPYMVMEYCPGETIVDHSRTLPLIRKLALFRSACDAVDYAHRNLIVHRDLKPANILVDAQGDIRLLDFGIARLLDPPDDWSVTQTGFRFFTPDYASPEQVRGEPVSTATDIYSLGAVLGELTREYAKPDLTYIIRKAMHDDPRQRYHSAASLSADIGYFVQHRPVAARPNTLPYRTALFLRRHRMPAIISAALLFCLLAGIAAVARQAHVAGARFAQVRHLAHNVLFEVDANIRDLPGSTRARQLIAKTAVEYLDSLYSGARDAQLQQELAFAYERVGDAQGEPGAPNLGLRDVAMRSYRRAAELWEGAGTGKTTLARVYMKLASITGSREYLDQSLEAATKARAAGPPDEATYATLVRVRLTAGRHFTNRLRNAEAQQQYQTAAAIASEWGIRYGGAAAQEALADALQRSAEAYARDGDAAATLEAVDRSLALRSPTNRRARLLTQMLRGAALGNPRYVNLGRPSEAIRCYEDAVSIAETMLAEDPGNALARNDLGDASHALAVTLTASNPRRALDVQKRALTEYTKLVQNDPKALPFRQDVADSNFSLAEIHLRLGDRETALRHLLESIRLHRSVADARPSQPGLRHNLLPALALLIRMRVDARRPEQAASTVEEAAAIMASVESNPPLRTKRVAAEAAAAIARYNASLRSPEQQLAQRARASSR